MEKETISEESIIQKYKMQLREIEVQNILKFEKFEKDFNSKEWELEPDELEWVDSETFLSCRIIRNKHMRHLCGYVAIELDQKLSREQFDQLVVHGGVTHERFSENTNICWFGFHCAHYLDVVPFIYDLDPIFSEKKIMRSLYGAEYIVESKYRNILYVINQCQLLAFQLQKFRSGRSRLSHYLKMHPDQKPLLNFKNQV